MTILFSLIQYACTFLFGAAISFLLTGAHDRPRFRVKAGCICVILLLIQLAVFLTLGVKVVRNLYPVIVHFPLWILMIGILKVPKLQSAVSILIAYMCCQLPRWVASLGLIIPEYHLAYQILYILATSGILWFLEKYLISPARWFLERSQKICLLMSLVPGIYYVFDYVTAVYTSLLLSGNLTAVQFMPSVVALAYLMFIVLYNREVQQQNQLTIERDLIKLQLQQTKLACNAISQYQEKTRQYRHDMRHHFTLLQSMAEENNIKKIREYLNTVQQDIGKITPVRMCGNEVVNLLLSYYSTMAAEKEVELIIAVNLPNQISLSDTEVCSLLSNGLENAIDAACQVPPPQQRKVEIHIGVRSENLLIQIENTFTGEIQWMDGLPYSTDQDHGFGSRSIRTIVRSHGGETVFRTNDGVFQLRILLPLNP